MIRKVFDEVVLFARTGLNPRTNFKLGTGNNYYITIKNIHNNRLQIDDNTDMVDDAAINLIHKRSQIKKGDILFCSIGRLGDMYIITEEPNGWDINESVFAFTVDTSIIRQKYFYYLFKHQGTIDYLSKNSSGSTFKSIKMNQLKKMVFDLPSLDKQDRIVDVLDSLSKVIEMRENEINKLDELVKARFVEMFGDPYSNSKKWKTLSFKEAGEKLSDGPFGSNLKSEHYTDEGVRVIRLGNIGVRQFIDNDKSYISEEHYKKLSKYTCRAGEIVIATLGEPNLRACLVPEDICKAIHKADCVHYIPKKELLNNDFVCQYVNCPETLMLVQGMIHGQTRSRVSSGQIAQMPIFIPPLELQIEFSNFVKQVDKSKVVIQRALDEAQLLFDSLMQLYFE